jgi:hypothetical protein
MTSRFHNGKEIVDPPLQGWVDNGLQEKRILFFWGEALTQPTTKFKSFEGCILAMRTMFRGGFSAREAQSPMHFDFDEDTLGGLVTFEEFEKILRSNLPSPLPEKP